MPDIIFLNQQFMPASEAKISPRDRGFRFGDGVFETIPFFGNKPYRLPQYLSRLEHGLRELRIVVNLDFPKTINELIAQNEIEQGFIRISISRGEGSIGYLYLENNQPTIFIEIIQRRKLEKNGYKLCLSQIRKISAQALPISYKLSQGINPMLAAREAIERGCDDALMLNNDGMIAEASSGNIFWRSGGLLCTPSLDSGILAGITREIILELSPYHIKQEQYDIYHLEKAEEIFICNSNYGIMPIIQLEPFGWNYNIGEYSLVLMQKLKEDIKQKCF